jgi:hypothetical protein
VRVVCQKLLASRHLERSKKSKYPNRNIHHHRDHPQSPLSPPTSHWLGGNHNLNNPATSRPQTTSHEPVTIESIKNSPAKKVGTHFDLIQLNARSKLAKSPITNLVIAPSILAEFVQTKEQTNRQYRGGWDGWWVWWSSAMKAALQRSELHRAKASRS